MKEEKSAECLDYFLLFNFSFLLSYRRTASRLSRSVSLSKAYGPNFTYYCHLAIDRCVPNRRLWLGLQIARAVGDHPNHNPDSVASRSHLTRI